MADRTIVKQVKYAKLYSDGTILFEDVFASYPHVLIPKGGRDKDGNPIEPAYSITVLLPKTTHRAAKDLAKEVIEGILKENKIKAIKADAWFLRDGNLSGKEVYEGNFTVSAREQKSRPPSVRDADGRTKLTEADAAKIYGGCKVNALVRPWFQNNSFGKRVNAGLTAVQFIEDGEPFGEGRISEDDIDSTFEDRSSGWEDDEASDL